MSFAWLSRRGVGYRGAERRCRAHPAAPRSARRAHWGCRQGQAPSWRDTVLFERRGQMERAELDTRSQHCIGTGPNLNVTLTLAHITLSCCPLWMLLQVSSLAREICTAIAIARDDFSSASNCLPQKSSISSKGNVAFGWHSIVSSESSGAVPCDTVYFLTVIQDPKLEINKAWNRYRKRKRKEILHLSQSAHRVPKRQDLRLLLQDVLDSLPEN
jgi:hypothetical protein